jgi:hypothetical protein
LVGQIGSHLLYTTRPNGTKGDVNVFKFFLFLAITLFVMGIAGAFALKVVDEGEMIEEAIDELEQSGLLDEGEFLRRAAQQNGYGTMTDNDLSTSTVDFLHQEAAELKRREAEELARKEWLLNAETRRFLKDRTVWWLALGFFLVTGPGEAYINNMGTIIGTLYPPSTRPEDIPTSAATHVSIVALSSTIARLLTGTVTDLLAPSSDRQQHNRGSHPLASSLPSLEHRRWSISRVWFLLGSAAILSIGQILLASGVVQNHGDRFWAISALIGTGYGAVFSLTPIIVSVVWGVENFASHWGLIATVPAAGAALWGGVYSAVYEAGASLEPPIGVPEDRPSELCFGLKCYTSTFWAMAGSVWIACCVWIYAWRGPGGWTKRGVAV